MLEQRLDEELGRLVEQAAGDAGVSVDTYVREAIVMRLMLAGSRSRGQDIEGLLDRIAEGARPRPDGPDPSVAAVVLDPDRLHALRATGLLDSPPEPEFDRVVELAAEALGAPTAAISLVDSDRQFFKSEARPSGTPEPPRERSLAYSLCQYAVGTGQPLVVEDAREDPVLSQNRSVVENDLVAYVGVPLADAEGHALGTLCVWDSQPRQWSRGHVQILEDLARLIVARLPRPAAPPA